MSGYTVARTLCTTHLAVLRPTRGCPWPVTGHGVRGSDPSSGPRPLVKARGAVHLLPSEKVGKIAGRARARAKPFPSPQGRGGTARRRGPHVLQVVGVRGHFLAFTPDSNHIDHKRPTPRSARLDVRALGKRIGEQIAMGFHLGRRRRERSKATGKLIRRQVS